MKKLLASITKVLLKPKIDKTGSIESIKRYISKHPGDEEAHFNLAISFHLEEQYNEAIEEYRKAIKIDPKYDTHFNLGLALFKNGDLDLAINEYKESIRIKPDNIEPYYLIGEVLFKKGNLSGVTTQYTTILNKFDKEEIPPACADNHYDLGKALLEIDDIDGALDEFKNAIEIDDKFDECIYYIAIILMKKGRHHESISTFKKFIESAANTKGFLAMKQEAQEFIDSIKRGDVDNR